jgi:hypothetical protein
MKATLGRIQWRSLVFANYGTEPFMQQPTITHPEFPNILLKPKINSHVHKSPPLVCNLRQMNKSRIRQACFSHTHF